MPGKRRSELGLGRGGVQCGCEVTLEHQFPPDSMGTRLYGYHRSSPLKLPFPL